MSSTPTSTTQRLLFPLLAVLLGCLAGAALAEGYLRVVGPNWLKARMQEIGIENKTGIDPAHLWSDKNWPIERTEQNEFVSFVPNSEFPAAHYEFKHPVNIDEFGGRLTTTAASSTKKNINVPFMGDSFLFGLGVQDEETYVSILGENSEYRLLNFGYPGSALSDQLDIIEWRHHEINNSGLYIFNFFTGNDYTNILTYHTKTKKGTTALQPRRGPLTIAAERINDFLNHNRFFRNSYAVQFIKARALYYHNQRKRSLDEPYRMGEFVFYVIHPDKNFPRMVELLDWELERLDRLSRELNFKKFFIIVPDRLQVDDRLLQTKIAYYGLDPETIDVMLPNRVLHQKLEERKIPFIDVTPCVREAVKNGEYPVYYTLDTHLTAYGHRIVAQCIKERIRPSIVPLTLSESVWN